jgi:hypothetical protein
MSSSADYFLFFLDYFAYLSSSSVGHVYSAQKRPGLFSIDDGSLSFGLIYYITRLVLSPF